MIARIRNWPWAVKLAVLLVAVAIVPLCALTIYTDVVMRRELVAVSSARDLQRARNTAALLDGYLQTLVADVTLVALASPTISVLEDPAKRERAAELSMLLRNVQRNKDLPELLLLDYTGTVVASTDSELVGRDRIAAPFFLAAMAGQVRAHDPRYLPDEDRVYMHVSAPVRDSRERVLGVVGARVPLEQIDRLIAADTDFGGLGEQGLLWDERGIAISSPATPQRRFRPLGRLPKFTRDQLIAEQRYGPETASLVGAAGPAESLVQYSRWLMYDERSDPISRVDLGEGLQQVAAAPMRDRRWTYAIVVPERAVLAEADELSQRNLAVALGMALAALALALASARWLSRPLSEVGNAARALAAGDMTRRVRLQRRDEVGQMSDAFDAMADAIARKDAELRQHAESLERRVAERTAELRGLLTAMPDLMFRVDRAGRLIDYVAAKEKDLALPPEEFLGRRLSDVMPPDIAEPALAAVERALGGEPVPSFEYTLTTAGTTGRYEARTSASGADSVVFIIRNVTSQRQHEERMRFLARAGTVLTSSLDYGNIVESLAQLLVPFAADVCIVDLLEHRALRVGAVAAHTSEERALLHAIRAEFPVRLDSQHPVARALRGGAALYQTLSPALVQELAGSPEHGRLMTTVTPRSLIVLPLVARGQTVGAMSLLTTASGRAYTDADLLFARELAHRAGIALENARLYWELQESSRLKDEFLGIVSHELRTPLNAVLGWAQVLRRSPKDADQARRAVDAIERNARAQAKLVEDLLETSRAIGGKIQLEVTAIDVRTLVENSVESFAPIAKSRGLDLSVSIDDAAGAIRADPLRLQQVFGNLLSNAVKFTPAGGTVRVSVRRTGSIVEVRVADSGSGIPQAFLPFVFDRFRQADSTTTRAHGGLGLGLAIARHLVELHRGSIRAESSGPNQGSVFVVLLPAVPLAAADVSGGEAPVERGIARAGGDSVAT